MIWLKYLVFGVKNLFYYFKVVWRDRDWDENYIYILLLYKIRKQRKKYQLTDCFVGQKYVVVQMRACEIILERLLEGWYMAQIRGDSDDGWTKKWVLEEERQKVLLFVILNRYIDHWWD